MYFMNKYTHKDAFTDDDGKIHERYSVAVEVHPHLWLVRDNGKMCKSRASNARIEVMMWQVGCVTVTKNDEPIISRSQ